MKENEIKNSQIFTDFHGQYLKHTFGVQKQRKKETDFLPTKLTEITKQK